MWSDEGKAQLAKWGISIEQAEAVGAFETPNAAAVLAGVQQRPGIILPYWTPDRQIMRINDLPFGRVRWLDTPKSSGFHGKQKAARYGQPPGTGVQVYFPPVLDWAAVLADPTLPVIITEGEAKGIVATLAGYRCVALGGVYSFADRGELVAVLAGAKWQKRPVAIIYDSDAATNPNVLAAEARLVEELGTNRGADVRIVRLPDDGGAKMGLDDFLNAKGTEALDRLIQSASSLGALDSKIIGLNRTCAWIDQERGVYDLETGLVITKADFVNGSRFSTLTHIVASTQQASVKTISVSERWLKHPHAQRYSQILFRPGEGLVVEGEHGRALNQWTGWNEEPGDVGPWLELTDFLFGKDTQEEVRALPLRLMAYKAQNPQEKIPLALVLTGPQGSGKTLWLETVRDAFAPYSAAISPSALASEFFPWMEKSVFATINELDVETMRRHAQILMALISDERRQLNDKYRVMREINSPTLYGISSNYSGVGSGFTHDDRRIISVQCPKAGAEAFYDRVWNWRHGGGARRLMYFLLNYDLQGWRPPRRAPATAAKRMAYREGMTPIQMLAEDMQTSGVNTLIYWIDLADQWAAQEELSSDPQRQSMARAVRDGVRNIQVRPWYTAEELTLIFPSVLSQVYATSRRDMVWTPGQMSRQLRDSGIPFLVNYDNPDGFQWQGRTRQYLVISAFEDWAAPIGQADFERAMRNWPNYAQIKAQAGKTRA